MIIVRVVKQVAVVPVQRGNICDRSLGRNKEDPDASRITLSEKCEGCHQLLGEVKLEFGVSYTNEWILLHCIYTDISKPHL